MQIGVQIPDFTTPGGPARLGADLAAVGRAADEAGCAYGRPRQPYNLKVRGEMRLSPISPN